MSSCAFAKVSSSVAALTQKRGVSIDTARNVSSLCLEMKISAELVIVHLNVRSLCRRSEHRHLGGCCVRLCSTPYRAKPDLRAIGIPHTCMRLTHAVTLGSR